jgi:hypothetical protein
MKLQLYADSILKGELCTDKESKIFLKLIKFFHPDRLNYMLQDIEKSFHNDDVQKLQFYKNLLAFESTVAEGLSRRFEIELAEDYQYDDDDLRYHASGVADSHDDEVHEVEERFDVITAVKAEYLGNIDCHIEYADLSSLEGDLDLSDYNIDDLHGLQYCRNITSLNLSNNCISDICHIQHLHYLEELFISDNHIASVEYLRGLSNLKIIDLSQNEVQDVSPLAFLDSLEFVNLRNNPVSNNVFLQKLKGKSFVVV